MLVRDANLSDFEDAERFLAGRTSRTLCLNTVVERDGNDTVNVRFHQTVIVQYHRDGGATLWNGSWKSRTTKARINKLLPTGWTLLQTAFEWFLVFGYETLAEKRMFIGGVRVYPDGRSVGL
jgi:hypothetical protein